MGKGYIYIYGYTDVKSFTTEIESIFYDSFSLKIFINSVINPVIKNDGLSILNLNTGITYLSQDYRLEYDDSLNTVKIFKKITQKGYIYNSYIEELLYIFFYKKVYDEDSCPMEPISDEIFEEKSVTEELTVEESVEETCIKEVIEKVKNLHINENDFLNELKTAVKKRIPKKIEEPLKFTEHKSDFENELQHMIKFRKDRCKKRERKLLMKKRK